MCSDDRLLAVFSETLNIPQEELNNETSPKTTDKWDSLANMLLIAGIEETFDIVLTDDDVGAMTSLGEVRRILRTRGVEGV